MPMKRNRMKKGQGVNGRKQSFGNHYKNRNIGTQPTGPMSQSTSGFKQMFKRGKSANSGKK